MSSLNDKIDVVISGAVIKGGSHLLTKPATICSAVDAAGGLAIPTSQMWASGDVSVRRPKGNRKVDSWRFKMDAPADWENFELQNGDLVVFQWHVEIKPN